ncbi:polysaccharide biosynthesis protein [Microvirga lenta]|uniref:hypothetical protein n=1 Tax=Microvirga lenta TaxID=2881337 RepID=UPI001CFFDB76|nr:hypothetical protein [Microvirga lenta]MCB5175222.1 hypothetical protein [Microvirga lenta]
MAAALRLFATQVLKGRPLRDAVVLGGRLVAARVMSLLTLIVAAWLVDIEAFAAFGVYQTLAALALIALFLRYDAAIVAARTEAEAGDALRLSIFIGTILWGVFAAASLIAGGAGLMRMHLALLLPLSILARGMLSLSFATAVREGDFKGIGRASLAQAIVQPGTLLALVLTSLDDTLCFAIADILGHLSAVSYLAWRRKDRFQPLWQSWSVPALVRTAKYWKSLPLYNLPSSSFSRAFVMSPLLIMPMVADAVFSGHVALAYRIFDVPTQIITAASTPIFLNRLKPSEERAAPIFGRHMMLGLMVLLGAAYAVMAGLLLLADPWLEGSELAGLAEAIPMVAMFQLFVALAAPLNDSCALYPQQRRLVMIQALSLFAGLFAAFLALRISPEGVLVALVAASAFRAFALGELLRRLSSLSRESFVRALKS